jgi:hypothetical protein
MVIRRVRPLSAAKVAGVIYATAGLIGGAILSLMALTGAAFAARCGQAASMTDSMCSLTDDKSCATDMPIDVAVSQVDCQSSQEFETDEQLCLTNAVTS